jgi:hypothetical protein
MRATAAAMSDPDTSANKEDQSLVDDLGVSGLRDLLFGKHGKLFSAAGRLYGVAEVENDGFVLHPPNKPLFGNQETEEIQIQVDEKGILLDELGVPKRIAGAKFNGDPVYVLGEKDASDKNLAGALMKDGKMQKLYLGAKLLNAAAAFKLRNKTHDGELSIFSDLSPTPKEDEG